ncbi:hypothetical protein ALC57_04053 [Trachymyrmex cornetzi]|uniref:Chromo domain-containing protein n=1 Tax=Trachymyrmex cornetzi TaxID=471704 RepID=A0A151JEY7_9HYME|nr:hypothetical protein ALC57_04053 [Trachymyrmex cornetzi]
MADVREREKIVREIEKTSESIRKKHRALKTGRIEEGISLDRHFKPLIEPLRLFADNPGERATKRESRDEDAGSAPKRERKVEEEQKEGEKASETFEPSATLHKSNDRSREPITSNPRAKIVPTIDCKCQKVERRYEPTWVRWVKSTSRKTKWSEEIFQIYRVLDWRNPRVYELRDLAGEVIDGIFYEQELARVEKNVEEKQFIVDRVIKSRGRGANKQVLVRWRGYPSKFDSWIPVSSLISLHDEGGTISSGTSE